MKNKYSIRKIQTAIFALLFIFSAVVSSSAQDVKFSGKRTCSSDPVIPASATTEENAISPENVWQAPPLVEIPVTPNQNTDAVLVPAVTYTVGSGGTYTTLAAAFSAISGGISAPVIFQMISSTTETYPLSFPAVSGASATNTITIYPTVTGVTINSNNSTGSLNLNNIDYLRIDGRVNATGTTADMTIQNTSTNGYALQFTGGATNNIIQYCKIKGRNNQTNEGVVIFGSGTNTNNTITNCEITYDNSSNVPRNLIYSAGSFGQVNSGITISNNLLHDYFVSSAGQSSAINLNSYSSTWTITGNSFYNSVNRASSAGGCSIFDLYVNAGDGYTISNNYFGGQAANCGGTFPYSFTGNYTNKWYHIYFTNGVSTTNANSVQGNTIANISFDAISSNNAIAYAAIYFYRGTANIGTTSGNTFGSSSTTGSITLAIRRAGSSTSNNYLHMIRYEGANTTIQNNSMGSISLSHVAGSTGGDVLNLNLIHVVSNSPTANITISNNTIGSTTTASSIQTTGSATQLYKVIRGITVTPSGSYDITVSNNTIANLDLTNIRSNTSGSTGPSSFVVGIEGLGTTRKITISGNTIYNLTSASQSKFTDGSAAVSGIVIENTSTTEQSVSQNTIYGLKSTHSSGDVTANGILCESFATVERNLIYGLTLETSSRSITSGCTGIQCNPPSKTVTVKNNIIRLGLYADGTTSTNGNSMAAIWLLSGDPPGTYTNTYNVYNNSTYITGDDVQDCPVYTGCIFSEVTATRTIQNNIMYNSRTSVSATDRDQHFAMVLGTTGTITCDYNNYYRPGGDDYATFAQANASDYTLIYDLDDWQDAKPYDDHSVYNEPGFIDETGVTPNMHMRTTAGTCSNKGITIASVTNDFDGDTRNSPPDIGADEYSTPTIIVWNGSNTTAWDNTSNWNTPVVPKWADVINIPAGQSQYPVITSSYAASAYDVTIGAGASITIEPNASLDIRGAVTNSNGTDAIYIKSDATGTGSLIQRDNLVEGYIERFVSGSTDTHLRRYHTVSIPLDESNESVTGLFLNSYLFYFSEPDNDWVAMGAPTQTPISEARGYLIYYVFGSDTTYSFQGPMKSGAFYPNVSGTFSGAADNLHGWNLIPNPYPSAINWSSRGGWSKSGVDNAVYVWKPGATYAAGDYASWVGGISVNGGTNYIPVGQGFFVHTNTTTPSIRMRNSSRVHNTTTFLKNAEAPLQDVFKLKIENSVGVTDELAVRFSEFATEDFDIELDAYGMGSESMVPNISTTSGLLKYGINSLPYVHGDRVIPVNVEYGQVEQLTFTASGMESFNYTPPILLEDTYLNKIQDLRLNPEYTFDFKPDQTHRFNLIFTNVDATEEPEESGWLIYKSGKKINMYLPEINGKEAFVSIFDMTGRNLLTEQMQFDGVEQVDSPLTTGVYIVKVVSGKKTYTKKLVVE